MYSPWEDKNSQREAPVPGSATITWLDGVLVFAFVLLALACFAGRWNGAYPFVYLTGDAANIASFAAARDNPELFAGDEVLDNPDNFHIYSTIHLPLIRTIARYSGDYGTAFVSLLAPVIFIQALGFYVLGRVIFRNRYWAAMLATVTLMFVRINLGEYWGIFLDALPRSFFQALLPWVLAAAFYWRSTPRRWPWVLAAAGALMYFHPVSAPGWMLAIWLGLWAFQPQGWSRGKRLSYMSVLAAVPLIVALPFLLYYLQNHAHGVPQQVPVEQVREIMQVRLGPEALDVSVALNEFVRLWVRPWEIFFWAWAALGGAVLFLSTRGESRRRDVYLVVLWTAGILITAIAIPVVEQLVSRAFHQVPLETDLIRGIRYTIPLMLLFCLWPLAELSARLRQPSLRFARVGICVLGGALVAIWANYHRPETFDSVAKIRRHLSCRGKQTANCMEPGWSDDMEALQAVRRQTAPGSRILTIPRFELAVRYFANRPVVYSYKDGSILAMTNRTELVRWYDRYRAMTAVNAETDPGNRTRALLDFSRSLGAEYLLVDVSDFAAGLAESEVDNVWSGNRFALWRLKTPDRVKYSR